MQLEKSSKVYLHARDWMGWDTLWGRMSTLLYLDPVLNAIW